MTQSAEDDAHDPRCYQVTGVPVGLPIDLCDCRMWRKFDAAACVIPPEEGAP